MDNSLRNLIDHVKVCNLCPGDSCTSKPSLGQSVLQDGPYTIPSTSVLTMTLDNTAPQLSTCSLPNPLMCPTSVMSSVLPPLATTTNCLVLNQDPVGSYPQANYSVNILSPMPVQTLFTLQPPPVQVVSYNTHGASESVSQQFQPGIQCCQNEDLQADKQNTARPEPQSRATNNTTPPSQNDASPSKAQTRFIQSDITRYFSKSPSKINTTVGGLNPKERDKLIDNPKPAKHGISASLSESTDGLSPKENDKLNVTKANDNPNPANPGVHAPDADGLNPKENDKLNVMKANDNRIPANPGVRAPLSGPADGLNPKEDDKLTVIKGNDNTNNAKLSVHALLSQSADNLNPKEHDQPNVIEPNENANTAVSVASAPLSESTQEPQVNSVSLKTKEGNVNKPSVSLEENAEIFMNWYEWLERWGELKSTQAYDQICLKKDFYRCMSYDCSYTTMNTEDFKEHLIKLHPGSLYICSYCLNKFQSVTVFMNHLDKHWSCQYQCHRCVYRASSPAHVTMHWQNLHSKTDLVKVLNCDWPQAKITPIEITNDHINPYRCTECSFETKFLTDFRIHKETVHLSVSCFDCKAVMPSFNLLLLHLRKHEIYDYHCSFCKFAAVRRETMYHHVCLNHPEKELQLVSRVAPEELDRKFISNDKLSDSDNVIKDSSNTLNQKVMDVVEDKTKNKGEEQGLSTAESAKIAAVIKSSLGNIEKPVQFTCEDCKKEFSTKKGISDHLMFSHNETDVQFCSMCPNYFTNQKLLERHHAKFHSSKRADNKGGKYLCVFCNFVTNAYEEMSEHLYKKICDNGKEKSETKDAEIKKWINNYLLAQEDHPTRVGGLTKLKPIKLRKGKLKNNQCPMCGRLLNCATLRIRHICMHLKYKPYSCCYCAENFQLYTDAINHAVKTHNRKVTPFNCFPSSYINNWIRKLVYGRDTSKWPVVMCRFCKFTCKDVSFMLMHFRRKHSKKPLSICYRKRDFSNKDGEKTDNDQLLEEMDVPSATQHVPEKLAKDKERVVPSVAHRVSERPEKDKLVSQAVCRKSFVCLEKLPPLLEKNMGIDVRKPSESAMIVVPDQVTSPSIASVCSEAVVDSADSLSISNPSIVVPNKSSIRLDSAGFDTQKLPENHHATFHISKKAKHKDDRLKENCQATFHSSTSAENKDVKYVCVFCNFETVNYEEIAEHLYKKIWDRDEKNAETKNVVIEKWIKNYLEAQENRKTRGAQKKLKPAKLQKEFLESSDNCPMCGQLMNNVHQKLPHVCMHLNYKPFSCSTCGKNFYHYGAAIKHAEEVHNEVVNPFTYFPTTFIDDWIRKLVFGEDTSKWPVIMCCLCSCNSRNVNLMLQHFKKEHPNKRLSICNTKYVVSPETGFCLDPPVGKTDRVPFLEEKAVSVEAKPHLSEETEKRESTKPSKRAMSFVPEGFGQKEVASPARASDCSVAVVDPAESSSISNRSIVVSNKSNISLGPANAMAAEQFKDVVQDKRGSSSVKFCSTCREHFDTRESLKNHRATFHSSKKAEHKHDKILENRQTTLCSSKRQENKGVKYLCVFCNFVTGNYEEMAEHLHKKIWNPDEKNAKTKNVAIEKWIRSYLEAQENRKAPGAQKKLRPTKLRKRKFKKDLCPMCGQLVSNAGHKLLHMSMHLNYKPYSCGSCGENFPRCTAAIRHAEEAHEEVVNPFTYFPTTYIDDWIRKLVFGEDTSKWPVNMCCLCNCNSRNINLMLQHFNKEHPNKPLSIRNVKYVVSPETSFCLDSEESEKLESTERAKSFVPEGFGQKEVTSSARASDCSVPVIHPAESSSISSGSVVVPNNSSICLEPASAMAVEQTKDVHSSKRAENKGVKYLCVFCNFATGNYEEMAKHLYKKIWDSNEKNAETKNVAIEKWIRSYLEAQENRKTPGANKKLRPTKLRKGSFKENNLCPMCGKLINNVGHKLLHMFMHLNYKPYSCGSCGKNFPKYNAAINHAKKVHEQEVNPFTYFPTTYIDDWIRKLVIGEDTSQWPVIMCGLCKCNSRDVNLMLGHFSKDHPNEPLSICKPKYVSTKTSLCLEPPVGFATHLSEKSESRKQSESAMEAVPGEILQNQDACSNSDSNSSQALIDHSYYLSIPTPPIGVPNYTSVSLEPAIVDQTEVCQLADVTVDRSFVQGEPENLSKDDLVLNSVVPLYKDFSDLIVAQSLPSGSHEIQTAEQLRNTEKFVRKVSTEPNNTSLENKNDTSDLSETEMESSDSASDSLKCSVCVFSTLDLNVFKEHCKSKHSMRGYHGKRKHSKDNSDTKLSKIIRVEKNSSDESFSTPDEKGNCVFCKYSTSSALSLSKHIMKNHGLALQSLRPLSSDNHEESPVKHQSNFTDRNRLGYSRWKEDQTRATSSDNDDEDEAESMSPVKDQNNFTDRNRPGCSSWKEDQTHANRKLPINKTKFK